MWTDGACQKAHECVGRSRKFKNHPGGIAGIRLRDLQSPEGLPAHWSSSVSRERAGRMSHLQLARAKQSNQCIEKLKCGARLFGASITPWESGVCILPRELSGDPVVRAQKQESLPSLPRGWMRLSAVPCSTGPHTARLGLLPSAWRERESSWHHTRESCMLHIFSGTHKT